MRNATSRFFGVLVTGACLLAVAACGEDSTAAPTGMSSKAIVNVCANSVGDAFQVSEDAKTLTIDGIGSAAEDPGVDPSGLECTLTMLKAPKDTITQILESQPSAEEQTAEWDGGQAKWTVQEDTGLALTITRK